MDTNQIDLYEFLTESELQHYYNSIKNELKISSASQLKYATNDDLKQIGLSRPDIRRLRKYYEKFFPHDYLSKIKRLLQAPTISVKRDDGSPTLSQLSTNSSEAHSAAKAASSPGKTPNNKHIIPADSISVNKQLGTGEFGIVQQGVWTNGSERIQVAIKCLCRERMQSNPMEFLKEAAIMHSIEHENIVRLYGVVLSTDSLMLVTELAHLRSLLECLKDSALRISFLTVPTLCEFAMQICNGMKYLENKRLIHRDLAARNILVFSKNKVKISDFGLSRALGVGKDYYKTNFNVNLKLPIAWCAPECINYLRFTNASDVWAYGVCLWEMFSYGFQPWAALTGLQILEAIDAPNFQRLEQPECCPRDYYQLMMKCWQDDPLKRPKFNEIYEMLPEIKPEQLKAVFNYCEPKKDHLLYRQGDIITVLDRSTNTAFWKGVLNSGKTGLFNPANTVAYLESLPSSNRDPFYRTSERYSKKKLRTEMISKPQNDLKHTGHIGIDGDSFGDVSFMANSQNYNHLPRQIVTPYKPSEDIEQTPLLLPPTPTSPLSLQTASSYFPEDMQTSSTNPTFVPSNENTPKQIGGFERTSFDFSEHQEPHMSTNESISTNPFANNLPNQSKLKTNNGTFGMQNNNYDSESNTFTKGNNISNIPGSESERAAYNLKRSAISTFSKSSLDNPGEQHEYHEISDDDIAGDKFDFGPSLLDEINLMFGSMSSNVIELNQSKTPGLEHIHKNNETTEYSSKLNRKSGSGEFNSNKTGTSKKKGSCTVKPISVKDEKILNHAIEIANEISARSMTDLVCEQASCAQSPKRKFSFRFPQLSNLSSNDKSNVNTGASGSAHNPNSCLNGTLGYTSSYPKDKKNFTEELKSIPDLQTLIGEEGRKAYKNLIDRNTAELGKGVITSATSLLDRLDSNNFEMTSAKTFPRRSVLLRLEEEAKCLTTSENTVLPSPDVSIPHQNAPRPMTLPTRGAASRLHKSDMTIYNFKGTLETNLENNEKCSIPANEGTRDYDSICESPSYLSNTCYSFPDSSKSTTPQSEQTNDLTDSNPIPLPPREGKKHIKSNPKRHVRKYPLIIPAYGVQRTLNKVTEMTTIDDDVVTQKDAMIDRTQTQLLPGNPKPQNIINPRRFTHEVVAAVRPTSRNSATYENTSSFSKEKPEPVRTYQNIPHVHKFNTNATSSSTTDSASLQFESILEDDSNKVNVLQSPDVTDGFYNFSIQKEHFSKVQDSDLDKTIPGLKNLDVNKNMNTMATTTGYVDNLESTNKMVGAAHSTSKKVIPENTFTKSTNATASFKAESSKIMKIKSPNELAGHALFMKVRESVDMAMRDNKLTGNNRSVNERSEILNRSDVVDAVSPINRLKKTEITQSEAEYFANAVTRFKDSNSVSCEDLLEFSDRKPKGCERGVDSDEVRIMIKVLGKETTPTHCLRVLEFIDWDVHKAIKLIKLQNILGLPDLSLAESVDILQNFEWDLQITAMKIKSIK